MMHEFFEDAQPFRVFISGQKYFGERILKACLSLGCEVAGVCCPPRDEYIGKLASINKIPQIPSGLLSRETMPHGVDLGITAHSFDYIGKGTRYAARLGWIGYHPSLLPRHRGRSAIEWAVRMKDPVTGGSVFWLNSGIDRGDIARQDWIFIDPKMFTIDPKKAASIIWREQLLPMGVSMMSGVISEVMAGVVKRAPQDGRFSTWEPSTDVKDIYRPDALMIGQGAEKHK